MKATSKGLLKYLLIPVSILTIFSFILFYPSIYAEPSPWISGLTPSLQKFFDLPNGSNAPVANQDCFDYKYKTTNIASTTKCLVPTVFGAMAANGDGTTATMLFNNSSIAGTTENFNSSYFGPYPIPNSSTVIHYTTGASKLFMKFTTNAHRKITQTTNANGSRKYKFSQAPDLYLRDVADNSIYVNQSTVAASSNGAWLIADYPFKAFLRVNLATFEVVPFAPSLSTLSTTYPDAQVAISNNGRYALIYSAGNYFKLYDLDTCTGTVPNTISAPLSCQHKDLWPALAASLSNIRTVTSVRFINDNTISFYVVYNYNSSVSPATYNISKFSMAAPGFMPSSLQYLGLGDSFSSGEGAFSYLASTNTSSNKCHLSTISYPLLTGSLFNSGSYKSIACSGARLKDIFNESDEYEGQSDKVTDLVKRKDRTNSNSILSEYRPGYITQTEFISENKPNVITLTVGGNDIGFGDIVKSCVVGVGTCYSTYEDRAELVLRINRTYPELVKTYKKLKENAAHNARIYVLGYPELAKADGNCALNVRLNNEEIKFSNDLIGYLNSIIEQAASAAGVAFVNTQTALYGHRMCEIKRNIAANGLTAGHDSFYILSNASFHPNALGHQLLSNVLKNLTQNLTTVMPAEDLSLAPPPADPNLLGSLPLLTNVPATGRTLNQASNEPDLVQPILLRNSPVSAVANGAKFGLKPNTWYNAQLHSAPVDLGNFITDADGNLSFGLNVPSSVAAGFHTLHIYGQNVAGEAIDIYKVIYVAANNEDYDGDGEPNSTDSCPVYGDTNIDEDQDGIDDGCDDEIGELPAPASTTQHYKTSNSGQQEIATVTEEDTPTNSNSELSPLAVQFGTSPVLGNASGVVSNKAPRVGRTGESKLEWWRWLAVVGLAAPSYFVKKKLRK